MNARCFEILDMITEYVPSGSPFVLQSNSMKRNVGISFDDHFDSSAASAKFDIVLDLVFVIRIPSWAYDFCDKNKVSFLDFTTALSENAAYVAEMLSSMSKYLAQNKLSEWVDTYKQIHQPLPLVSGDQTFCTIFGQVVDDTGRFISVTVTDSTTPKALAESVVSFIHLYDAVTAISSDFDYNNGGDSPYRGTVFGKDVKIINGGDRTSQRRANRKQEALPAPEEENTGEIHKLAELSDAKQLKSGAQFEIYISRISVAKDGDIIVNGFDSYGKIDRSDFMKISKGTAFGKWAVKAIDASKIGECIFEIASVNSVKLSAVKRVKNIRGSVPIVTYENAEVSIG